MKKHLKHTYGIAVLFFVAGVFFLLPTISFAAVLNGSGQDVAVLRVENRGVGASECAACWASSVVAHAGDIVSFVVFYHNTGNETATNLRVRLSPQTTGVGSAQTFIATVSADNAPSVGGTATVSIDANQFISFVPGSVVWRPNQLASGSYALLFGQTGAELFNGVGLNLGNIASGVATQGVLLVNFQVSANPAYLSQTTVTLSADQTNIPYGGATTLRWYPNGATACYAMSGANGWSGAQSTTGGNFNTGALTTTTTYTMTCSGSSGPATASVTVNVSGQQGSAVPMTTTLPATEISGGQAKLNGTVANSFVQASNVWFEWGTDTNVGNKTQTVAVNALASINHTEIMSGLASGQTYYYRIVAENASGRSYGVILSFSAKGGDQTSVATSQNGSPCDNASSSVDPAANITVKPSVSSVPTVESLTANILGASETNTFLPRTAFEWVLLMVLVLAFILLGNHLYGRMSDGGH